MVFNFAWMVTRKEMEFLRVWNFYRQTFRYNRRSFWSLYAHSWKLEMLQIAPPCDATNVSLLLPKHKQLAFNRFQQNHQITPGTQFWSSCVSTYYLHYTWSSPFVSVVLKIEHYSFVRKHRQEGQDIRITKGNNSKMYMEEGIWGGNLRAIQL